jgi:hypothetical protein
MSSLLEKDATIQSRKGGGAKEGRIQYEKKSYSQERKKIKRRKDDVAEE